MDVVWTSFCFYDFHTLLFPQFSCYFSNIFFQLPLYFFSSVFRGKYNMIFTTIFWMCCAFYFVLHLPKNSFAILQQGGFYILSFIFPSRTGGISTYKCDKKRDYFFRSGLLCKYFFALWIDFANLWNALYAWWECKIYCILVKNILSSYHSEEK